MAYRPPKPSQNDKLLKIYLLIGQHPILAERIRERMLDELTQAGMIDLRQFEKEVQHRAIESQVREGISNPLAQENELTWERRVAVTRENLLYLYYAQHFALADIDALVAETLGERGVETQNPLLSLNLELAPTDLVLDQARYIESLPSKEREAFDPRLEESKVVLIRNLISDQLRYINIAKKWFSVADLSAIRERKIGPGRIGGKAAGMLLAQSILRNRLGKDEVDSWLRTPDSWFIGADVYYSFTSSNNLIHWNDQKYKPEEVMRAEFPRIKEVFQNASFREDILSQLETMLKEVGKSPLIIRSSSLLEDNFGTAFAGKYESVFLPNQGTLKQNLEALRSGLKRIYASTVNPNALLYRRSRGLTDYDERMGILIQRVEGEKYGDYFLPHGAGVGFSRNVFRWAPQIRREEGFVRLVWGLGTRAVDRVGNDFPRLIALSHPSLRPSNDMRAIKRYSQHYVDLIDLKRNSFESMAEDEVLGGDYDPLRYIAQVEEDGYLSSLRSRWLQSEHSDLVITFEDLINRTEFVPRMRSILSTLENEYKAPVDIEFTLQIKEDKTGKPQVGITLLQCRPQSHLQMTPAQALPVDLKESDKVFETHFVVPNGYIPRVDYVLYVPAAGYYQLKDLNARGDLARLIGHLNAAMENESYIAVGPGRWGSSNSDLGVPIDYGDIYHAKALVEMAGEHIGLPPEPSLGTHFFQDLMEAQIYPLAIQMDDPKNYFDQAFFNDTPNVLEKWVKVPEHLKDALKLIRVNDQRMGSHLEVVMSDEQGMAVAFLRAN